MSPVVPPTLVPIQNQSPHAAAAAAVVRDHAALAVVATLAPIPLAEFVAVSAVHLDLIEKLTFEYGVPFSRDRAKAIVGALVSGGASQYLGSFVAASFALLVPGLGSIVAAITRPSVAAGVTYALGNAFVAHFEQGGSLLDIDVALTRLAIWRHVAQNRTDPSELARVVGARAPKPPGA